MRKLPFSLVALTFIASACTAVTQAPAPSPVVGADAGPPTNGNTGNGGTTVPGKSDASTGENLGALEHCPAQGSCECTGKTCALTCDGAGCNLSCAAGSDCTLACPGGSCAVTCENAASCTVDCAGGSCSVTTKNTPDVSLDCPGNGCGLHCSGATTCETMGCKTSCQTTCGGAATCHSSCDVLSGGCSLTP